MSIIFVNKNRKGMKRMSKAKEYGIIFLFGGVIYSAIEVITRGFTHWSMTVTAGIALMIMYHRYKNRPDEGLLMKCLYGMAVITACEFVSGVIVNLILGWNVWDYSNMYLNFLGQICPAFCCAWFLLSVPASYICRFVSLAAGGEQVTVNN